MQPQFISKGKLSIAGLTGDGQDTGRVWGELEGRYAANPFPRADKNGYEIRYYNGEEAAIPGKDIHVGFAAADEQEPDGYETITLPSTAYISFDVPVASGYGGRNEEMNQWLKDHEDQYEQLQLDGRRYVVECYNEKFKDGSQPGSIVEIWIPLYQKQIGQRRVVRKDAFAVIGKMAEGPIDDTCGWIPPLWEEAGDHYTEIVSAARKDREGRGDGLLWWGLSNDLTESFRPLGDRGKYLVGCEADVDAAAPAGWTKWIVPAQTYLVVSGTPGAYRQMNEQIVNDPGITIIGAAHEHYPEPGNIILMELYYPIEGGTI